MVQLIMLLIKQWGKKYTNYCNLVIIYYSKTFKDIVVVLLLI